MAGRSAAERGAAAEERRARRAAVTDTEVVMAAAAGLLAVRQRSVAETRRRLLRLGYRAELCDAVVERLVELGYLDDAAFARAWVEGRDRARPRGQVVLRRELRRKGIGEDVIGLVLAERRGSDDPRAAGPGRDVSLAPGLATGEDDEFVELAAARRLLERRRASLERDPDPGRRRQRAYALLARNGFGPDVCRSAVEDLMATLRGAGEGV